MPAIARVDQLLLDPNNPRLPEHLIGSSQAQIFAHLYANGVLMELVESLLDNGYFEHEPLLVLEPNKDGHRVVVEGNRRLSALMLIHGHPATEDVTLAVEPDADQRERLEEVPIVEVKGREEIRRFLGYRHISGLKPWPAEAKARYVAKEVDRAGDTGSDNPFWEVARQIGSNTSGVRNSYIAYASLRHAQRECGAPVGYVFNMRFGVWLRCMNSPDIRDFIELGDPKSYPDVVRSVETVSCSRLTEVIRDLSPEGDKRKAIVQDSRDVTAYGQVLQNEEARKTLRKYGDLDIAYQTVKEIRLPERVRDIKKRIDALQDEVVRLNDLPAEDLNAAANELFRSAVALRATVAALLEQ